jgi:hypothetical protein
MREPPWLLFNTIRIINTAIVRTEMILGKISEGRAKANAPYAAKRESSKTTNLKESLLESTNIMGPLIKIIPKDQKKEALPIGIPRMFWFSMKKEAHRKTPADANVTPILCRKYA